MSTSSLWALLAEDERAHVISCFLQSALSLDLERAAMLDRQWAAGVRQEHERRTTRWRGGLLDSDRVEDESLYVGATDDEDDAEESRPPATAAKRILAKACDDGNVALVKMQLADGVPVDFFYGFYETPLCRAVERGHAECARLLLEARAAILNGGWEPQDYTSLYCAAIWMGHLDVVRVLTEFGVPRWGHTFTVVESEGEEWDAEAEATGPCSTCSPERQQQIKEFLVATRKCNPWANDPEIYTSLQAEEQVKILLHGSKAEQRRAIKVLRFLCYGRVRDYGTDLNSPTRVAASVKLRALDALGGMRHDCLLDVLGNPWDDTDAIIVGMRYDCLLDVLGNPWDDGPAQSLGLVPMRAAPNAQIEIMCMAAHHGLLNAIKWLRANGWAWDGTVCGHAAIGIYGDDHAELKRWLSMNGCTWDEDTDKYLTETFGEEGMQEQREADFRDWQANSLHYHGRGHRKLGEFFSLAPRLE